MGRDQQDFSQLLAYGIPSLSEARVTVLNVKFPSFKMAVTYPLNLDTLCVLKLISYQFATPGLNGH